MEKPILAVRTVLSKYATFGGRASRPEFWWWVLAIFVVNLVTQVIDAALTGGSGQPLSFLVSLALLLPGVAVFVRRLHDTGRSVWWMLLALIPIFGFLVLLWVQTRPSDEANQWGPPDPLY